MTCGDSRCDFCALKRQAIAGKGMPVMYAMSEDRARPPGPGRAEHELPVLFHLMDVSRPRQAPEASPPARQTAGAGEAHLATPPVSENLSSIVSTLLSQPTLPQPAPTASSESALPPPNPYDSVVASLAPLPATHRYPVSDTLLASVTSQVSSGGPAGGELPEQGGSSTTVQSLVHATEAPEAPPGEKPKNQLVSRRNHKTTGSEDWFATHGKYIAIGFVLALVGTIWMARNNRQQSNSASAASPWKSPLADEQTSDSHKSPSITIPAASSAHSTVLVSADSQVELHPPTTPQFAAGARGDGKSNNLSLP
jgi:hypothetical protein